MGSHKRLVISLIVLLAGLTLYGFSTIGREVPYSFIKADHSIDVEFVNGSRWLYYGFEGKPEAIVANVRKELAAAGYIEDTKSKPWFRFTKGSEEVDVCLSGTEAFDNGPNGGLRHMTSTYKNPYSYTDVWVKRAGGSKVENIAFKIKKTVLLW